MKGDSPRVIARTRRSMNPMRASEWRQTKEAFHARASIGLSRLLLLILGLWLPIAVAHSAPPPTLSNVRYGAHERQVLDFWKAESGKPTPLVFYIHGGGWMFGDKNMVVGMERYLAAGISVVSINYRYTSHAHSAGITPPVKAPMEDAACALQFVRGQAAEWNIDKARIAATGRSAGACTSLWLAFHDDMADAKSSDPVARESTRLLCAAVVRAQATLDPKQMREWTPNSDYGGQGFGFTDDPMSKDALRSEFPQFLAARDRILPWIQAYSPWEHITRDDPPIYLIFDSKPALGLPAEDPTHTANFGVKLQEKLQATGIACELVYPGAPNVQHASEQDYLIGKLTSTPDKPRDLASRVPKFTFATELGQQETQLKENPTMQHFHEARLKDREAPWRPAYHFSSPEAQLNDPNGLCFWQGRWHLFYQARPPEDARWHWAHAVSDDLIHWRDLPYAIYPNPEEQSYSGTILIEKDRAIAMYHGRGLGNMVAVSSDPLLLNWEKVTGNTVIPLVKKGVAHHFLSSEPLPYRIYDPCIWKKDGVYYSLSGSVDYRGPAGKPVMEEFLFRSKDLAHWEFVHPFVESNAFTHVGDDGACPNFWPIGDRHILLFFSHTSGGQYLLGDYDQQRDKFNATSHGRFNFGPVSPGGVHAPSATPDGKGGVIAIFNMNSATGTRGNDSIMTLPRRLTLLGKDELAQEPAGDIESLRGEHQHIGATPLPANQEIVLPNIRGNTMEIIAEIDSKNAPLVELSVLRSANAEEVTRISLQRDRNVTSRFMPPQRKLSVVTLDNSRSSLLPEAQSRPPESATVAIPEGEPVKLRIFIDRSVVEVSINGRQCLALRVHPSRADSVGVSLRSQGQPAELRSLDAWNMKAIQP